MDQRYHNIAKEIDRLVQLITDDAPFGVLAQAIDNFFHYAEQYNTMDKNAMISNAKQVINSSGLPKRQRASLVRLLSTTI